MNETRTAHTCVKPVYIAPPPSMEILACGSPAVYVGVRYDGWVSETTWCAEHVEADTERYDWQFTWQLIKEGC